MAHAVFYGPKQVSRAFDHYDEAYEFFMWWVMQDVETRKRGTWSKVHHIVNGVWKLVPLRRKTLRIKAIAPRS